MYLQAGLSGEMCPIMIGNQSMYVGFALNIAMGFLTVITATLIPQGTWGSPDSYPGEMHKIVRAIISLLTTLSVLLIGIRFNHAKIFPGIGIYSFQANGAAVLSASFFAVNYEGPIMGLVERVSILIGFLWTFILALRMYKNG